MTMPSHAGTLSFFNDLHPPKSRFQDDVLEGLSRPQKSIPPKHFYDARGSALFDDITDTEDYYVTRTELGILDAIAGEIAAKAGSGAVVIEPGSGSSVKIDKLLNALDRAAAYIGLDISKEHLISACEDLAARYDGLSVGAICADFTQPVPLEDLPIPDGKRLVFFPGSTIGNFEPGGAKALLETIRGWLRPGDALLIGADRVKSADILENAYDDASGVTAAFNLNLLTRINRELNGTIETDAFDHKAVWTSDAARVEMHLVAKRDTEFSVSGQTFRMSAGETIHTENSHKFSIERFTALAASAGLVVKQDWSDARGYFTLYWLERA
ncbi:L-histidine N(alpha)-methyltransferase [Hyphobacterium sp. CCMP332]|uniref:L-histidine N(alpha)-methyltransferase n=1 Tax=Hyphobacterium sp. CCMP332 TaxID=2749086 RepID=UPI00164FB831|nr:L-histidine N(alpha)-methyltransferase [Hyphobacterium sp. CCMP332]QNL20159.1 L-histidine N(alpha)-methyltransferase [Hyphobacterium sp. CCMP332]